MGKESNPKVLNIPKKENRELTEEDVARMSIASMSAMVDQAEALEDIGSSLAIISEYLVRKGKAEGFFSEDEFKGEENE